MKRSLCLLAVLCALSASMPPAAIAQEGGEDYIVQADDWLSKLADKYYGDVLYYWAIFDGTNDKNLIDTSYPVIESPDQIEPGWKLYIPTRAEADAYMAKREAEATPTPSSEQ